MRRLVVRTFWKGPISIVRNAAGDTVPWRLERAGVVAAPARASSRHLWCGISTGRARGADPGRVFVAPGWSDHHRARFHLSEVFSSRCSSGYVAVGLLSSPGEARAVPPAVSLLLAGFAAHRPTHQIDPPGRGEYWRLRGWPHTLNTAVTVASDHDFQQWLIISMPDETHIFMRVK